MNDSNQAIVTDFIHIAEEALVMALLMITFVQFFDQGSNLHWKKMTKAARLLETHEK